MDLSSLKRGRYGGLESQWADTEGLRVHVWTAPVAEARWPAVVLIHGIVSSRYLLGTAACLVGRHPVVAMDLPGFGRSAAGPRVFTITELADAAAASMAKAGVERPVVVGHSIGAQVAVELAVRRPDEVRGLVLVGPTGDPAVTSVAQLAGRWLATARREPLAFNALALRELAEVGPRRMLATARAAVTDSFAAKLPRVGAPGLVVRGEYDGVATAEWAERVRAGLRAAPVSVIRDVAHSVVFSAPRQLAGLINEFSQGLADGGAADCGADPPSGKGTTPQP